MGLCWAAIVILLMPRLNNIDAITFMLLIYFLGYGSVSLTPSIPFAAVGYFAPMLTASFVAGLAYDVMRPDLLIFITFSATVAMGRTLQQSWQDVREMVRTSLERLAAETQLRQREAQTAFFEKERQNEISRTQRNLIDAIPFPLVLTREGSFLPVGTQASRLFKVDLTKSSMRTIADFFVDPTELDRMAATQATDGQLDEFETRLKDTEGKPFWVMLSSRQLEYDGEQCWLNSVVVIDDRKRAEQALAEKEAQLRLVMDNMSGGIRLVDAEKNIVFFNQQYLDLYDFPPALLKIGEPNYAESFHQAERGDFGPGDPKRITAEWLAELPVQTEPTGWERTTIFGKTLQVSTSPIPDGGWVNVVTDVTERKRTEEELRQNRELLQALADNIPEFISFANLEGRFQFVNKCFEDWTGQDRRDVIGKTGDDIYPPEQARAFEAEDRACLESGKMNSVETQLDYPDGKTRTVISTRFPVLSANGEVLGLGTVNHDITDVRSTEALLKESENRMYTMLEASPIGAMIQHSDGSFRYANSRTADLAGMSKEEFLNSQGIDHFADPEVAREIGEIIRRDGRISDREVQFRKSDGSIFWALLSFERISASEDSDLFGWAYDINERKAAEVEQQIAKQRLEEQTQMLKTVSNQLAKYISPQLYQAIFRGEQKVAIESKRRKLTIFFSDIANFTEITDQLESEELTALLNQYLTEMSNIAQAHGANFDKFIGDAMMFYFGDPVSNGVKEDATACVHMAIAMQHRMHELREEWYQQGLEQPFELRVGINTGYCTVGNFGSEDRMDYTIIGSEVNLAARLQSHADVGSILLANETHSLVKDWLLAEEREAITVKGFAKPVKTFSVTGIYDDLAADGRVIHRDDDGLFLTIDRNQLSQKRKSEVIAELKNVLAELED